MSQPVAPSFDLAPAGQTQRRRGRPPGSSNKRSSDLGKYVAARFGGMTPGQQAAELCMVTAAELREAKALIRESGLRGISPMAVAMARRAHTLASVLSEHQPPDDRCTPKEAMALLIKAQTELMPYVHQKLPQAEPPKHGARNLVIAAGDLADRPDAPTDLPLLPVGTQVLDDAGLFDGAPEQVSQPKSHDAA